MKEAKPKSIRITGFVIALASALMLLNNGLVLVMAYYMHSSSEGTDNTLETNLLDRALAQGQMVSLVAVLLSFAFLVAGFYIVRHKNWARVLAQVVAVLFIMQTWVLMLFFAGDNPFDKGDFTFWHVVKALAWSVPPALLLWYLQQREVRKHFV